MHVMRIWEKDRRNIQDNNDGEFCHVNVWHQTTDPGSLENSKQKKCLKNYIHAYHFQATENQRKNPEEARI